MEGDIDVPVFKMIALANESEHMPEFVPFIERSNNIKIVHKARKVAYSFLNFPVISNRETYFYAEGFDRLEENGTMVLMSKSIHDDTEFKSWLGVNFPEATDNVRLDFHHYVYQIEPLSETRCRIRAITNVDPHVKYIPQSIMNWLGRKFAYFLFEKMIAKANTNFEKSVWAKAIENNPEFYEWINKKVRNYLLKKRQLEAGRQNL